MKMDSDVDCTLDMSNWKMSMFKYSVSITNETSCTFKFPPSWKNNVCEEKKLKNYNKNYILSKIFKYAYLIETKDKYSIENDEEIMFFYCLIYIYGPKCLHFYYLIE